MSTAYQQLLAQGLTVVGPSTCAKCGQPVILLGDAGGRTIPVNVAEHWEPHALHLNSCGQQSPEVRLPPPTDQHARLREIQEQQAALAQPRAGTPRRS